VPVHTSAAHTHTHDLPISSLRSFVEIWLQGVCTMLMLKRCWRFVWRCSCGPCRPQLMGRSSVATCRTLCRGGKKGGQGGDTDVDGEMATGRPPKPKRKRKPRYPKNFDPENPGPAPDPERWLPKHERAEFRKRRKRSQRNQPVSKGAQVRGPCLLLVREVLSPVACI
jgi:SRP72 RNA-binding domain